MHDSRDIAALVVVAFVAGAIGVSNSLLGQTSALPDLVIENIELVQTHAELAAVEFDVVNKGNAPVTDWFVISMEIDDDHLHQTLYMRQNPGTSYADSPNAVIPLEPGEKYHVSLGNYYWLAGGAHTITVTADLLYEPDDLASWNRDIFRDNMIAEHDEYNNTSTFSLFAGGTEGGSSGIGPGPDLEPKCKDTDGGERYDIKGSLSVPGGGFNDHCQNSNDKQSHLIEYFCKDGDMASRTLICPYGCVQGKCEPKEGSSCVSIIDNESLCNDSVRSGRQCYWNRGIGLCTDEPVKPAPQPKKACCKKESSGGVACEQYTKDGCYDWGGEPMNSCGECFDSHDPIVGCCTRSFGAGGGLQCQEKTKSKCVNSGGTPYTSCKECFNNDIEPKYSCCFPAGNSGLGCEQWTRDECKSRNGTIMNSCQQCFDSHDPIVGCCTRQFGPNGSGSAQCEEVAKSTCIANQGTQYSDCNECLANNDGDDDDHQSYDPLVGCCFRQFGPNGAGKAQCSKITKSKCIATQGTPYLDCKECLANNDHDDEQHRNQSSLPPAGFEEEVIVNQEVMLSPFPDANIQTLEGKAAADLYKRAVIGGFPDGEFKGYRGVNRAEAAKFLLTAKLGTVSDRQFSGRFRDVLSGEWYVKYVETAASLGVINGYSDGSFRPGNPVNTAEFLKMLTLTFDLPTGMHHKYTDVSSDDWFDMYAGTAYRYELFPGRGTSLRPGSELTRGEVAIAIYRYLESE